MSEQQTTEQPTQDTDYIILRISRSGQVQSPEGAYYYTDWLTDEQTQEVKQMAARWANANV